MSEADEAFERAREEIRKVSATGAPKLELSGYGGFYGLVTLPENIGRLTNLEVLDLRHTKVTNIEPLMHLTTLHTLNLSGTPITDFTPLTYLSGLQTLMLEGTYIVDLKPLRELHFLHTLYLRNSNVKDISPLINLPFIDVVGTWHPESIDPPRHRFTRSTPKGLFFKNIPATQSDPELARLSEIEDNAERTQQTLAYLREQAAKDQPEPPADQPAAPHYVLGEDGRLLSEEVAPGQWDAEQAELQQDLVGKAASLATLTAGRNEPLVAALHQQAEAYRRIISRNSPDLPLKRLWSAANALRASYEGSQASEAEARLHDVLPPLIAAALRDLVETHGLFIMGFPEAREIEAKIRGYLTGERNPDALAEGQAILEQLHDEGVLPEEEFATAKLDAAVAGGEGPSAEMGEISFLARVDNMILAISRRLRSAVKYSGHAVASGMIGNTAYAWIVGNQSLVASFLEKTLGDISYWFPKLIDAAQKLLGG